jgi:gluconokinase
MEEEEDGGATQLPKQQQQPQRSVILAIDIGSSSIRCTAYETTLKENDYSVVAATQQPRRSVHPGTGRIVLVNSSSDDADSNNKNNNNNNSGSPGGDGATLHSSVLDDVDASVETVLEQLLPQDKILAVGFSTFNMNLVGVDRHGKLVGEEATMSYACQLPQVHAEVEALKV